MSTQSVAKMDEKERNKQIVDVFGYGNVVIFEMGYIPLIFLVLFAVSAVAALSLGIYALSEWSKGTDYKNSKVKENNYDIWTYVVSGLALLLGTIFFIMLIVFYATRKKRFDEKILIDESNKLKGAILTKRYGNFINKPLKQHSKDILKRLEDQTQKITLQNLAIPPEAEGEGEGGTKTTDKPEYEFSVRKPRDLVPQRTPEELQAAKIRRYEAYLTDENPPLNLTKSTETPASSPYSPISLSRSSRRRKSPSSLKKKKKPSPSSLKKKKASPSSLKKKKSTSSKRK